MGTSLTNIAEITNDSGDDPDSTPDNEDPLEDDEDDEPLTVNQSFDLALLTTLATGQSAVVNAGDTVDFTITVVNQGTLDATNTEIVDYVPSDMSFNPSYNTSAQTGNVGDWNADSTYVIPSLAAGDTVRVNIRLVVDSSFMGTSIQNWVEISADSDDDIDSTPDKIDGNGTGESTDNEDDQIEEDGTVAGQDEDDHDQAAVTVTQAFDLALTKALATGQSATVNAGDTVDFTITVTNEGTLDAVNTEISDRVPAGLNFNAAMNTSAMTGNAGDWNADSTYVIPSILAGASASVNIRLVVDASFMGTSLTNIAEITNDSGDDPDSTPDNEDPLEDDEDDEPLTVEVEPFFDLALIETLAPGQASVVNPGATVDLEIRITNQGTINADFIEVTQYLPEEATLNAVNSINWIALNDSTALTLLSTGNGRLPVGGLAPDSVVVLTLQVILDVDATATEFIFNAEISEDGINNDVDSTPDDDRTNDAGGEVNTATDDIIDQVPPVDEDDEDPAIVSVQFFDLALVNVLVTDGDVMPGDSVSTKITVFNQGDVPADSIRIYAYIPDGLILDDANWSVYNDSTVYTTCFPCRSRIT